jgi:imidazolonepropionase-like amidohydrolase
MQPRRHEDTKKTIWVCSCAVVLTVLLAPPLTAQQQRVPPTPAAAAPIAIKAGRLIDPEAGTAAVNQTVLVQDGKIAAVGANVAIPPGAQMIDLPNLTVLPGLVEAHNHLTMTLVEAVPLYGSAPRFSDRVFDSSPLLEMFVTDTTAYRALEGAGNAFTLLDHGFTLERDLGNSGLYADTALRQAIEAGWIPGPTIVNSGIIIGGFGGQFHENAERSDLIYPEYMNADTNDEIAKAIRKNIHYGARVIKVCVDCEGYPYSVDQMKFFVSEAANAGLKVACHVQTERGARNAIEAGVWSIEHGRALTDELLQMMKAKDIFRVGTDFPMTSYRGNQAAFERTVDRLKAAYRIGVKSVFSTDFDYYVPGMTRGDEVIDGLITWKAAGIPAKDILKAMTTYGYQVLQVEQQRGPIKVGLAADMIAVSGDPLADIDVLRKVDFVMKDGKVFKQNGVATPSKFYK